MRYMYEKVGERNPSWVMRMELVGWGGGMGVKASDLNNVQMISSKEDVNLLSACYLAKYEGASKVILLYLYDNFKSI